MYIKKTVQIKNNKEYFTFRLFHSYRDVNNKVRCDEILNLGAYFNLQNDKWAILCDTIQDLLDNKPSLFESEVEQEIKSLANKIVRQIHDKNKNINDVEKSKQQSKFEYIDLNTTEDISCRFIGNEIIALHTCNQLKIKELLTNLGFNNKQVDHALSIIIARLISPGSELSTYKYIKENSALNELMGNNVLNMNINHLYKIGDLLYKNKDEIEKTLYQTEKDLLNFEDTVTLFDITNTYFEGNPDHTEAHLGRSKDKKAGSKLISVGLLLNSNGLPIRSKILPGNISEPKTLKEMLDELNTNATVIMDAGIATNDNIEFLKTSGYKYIVVNRSHQNEYDEKNAIVVKDTVHNTVKVSLIKSSADEVKLYCHSTAKAQKAKSFIDKQELKFIEDLNKLQENLISINVITKIENIVEPTLIITPKEVFLPTTLDNKLSNIAIIIDDLKLDQYKEDTELSQMVKDNSKMQTLFKNYEKNNKLTDKDINLLINSFEKYLIPIKRNCTRKFDKVLEKVGRLKEQYKNISFLYQINVVADQQKLYALKLEYSLIKSKKAAISRLSIKNKLFFSVPNF